jgi:hypothetical protein
MSKNTTLEIIKQTIDTEVIDDTILDNTTVDDLNKLWRTDLITEMIDTELVDGSFDLEYVISCGADEKGEPIERRLSIATSVEDVAREARRLGASYDNVMIDVLYNGLMIGPITFAYELYYTVKVTNGYRGANDHSWRATVGFNEEENRWYAWGQDGMVSYGVGDRITSESIGYLTDSLEEIAEAIHTELGIDKDSITVEKNAGMCVVKVGETSNGESVLEHVTAGLGEYDIETIDMAKNAAVLAAIDMEPTFVFQE